MKMLMLFLSHHLIRLCGIEHVTVNGYVQTFSQMAIDTSVLWGTGLRLASQSAGCPGL